MVSHPTKNFFRLEKDTQKLPSPSIKQTVIVTLPPFDEKLGNNWIAAKYAQDFLKTVNKVIRPTPDTNQDQSLQGTLF